MKHLMCISLFLTLGTCSNLMAETLVVYLHGMSKDPLQSDQAIIKSLEEAARAKGFDFISPVSKDDCSELESPKPDHKCWPFKNSKETLQKIEAHIDLLEKGIQRKYSKRWIIGFSNGGYFLSRALADGSLGRYQRVGVISGGLQNPQAKVPMKYIPKVFVENASKDEPNLPHGQALCAKFENAHCRLIDREHRPSANEAASFFKWMSSDAKPEANTP